MCFAKMVLNRVLNRKIKQMIDNYTKEIRKVNAVCTGVTAFGDTGLIPSATARGVKVHKRTICAKDGSKCTKIYGRNLGTTG